MAYTSIRTAHSVGDVVFFYDSEADSVQRGVVVGVEAFSTEGGHSPKWTVMYRVAPKFAADPPGHPSLICEADLKDSASEAFPPLLSDESAPITKAA